MLWLWFYDILCQTLNRLVNIGLQHARSLEPTLLWTGSVGPQAAWRLLPHCKVSLTLCHLFRWTVGYMQTDTFFSVVQQPSSGLPCPVVEVSRSDTHTLGRTPLDEGTARPTDRYRKRVLNTEHSYETIENMHDLLMLNRIITLLNTLKKYLFTSVMTYIPPLSHIWN